MISEEGVDILAFLQLKLRCQPIRDKVLKVVLRGDASRVAHFRAPSSPRGICTLEHRCEVRVSALGARPQSAGISRELSEEESSARFRGGMAEWRDPECEGGRDSPIRFEFSLVVPFPVWAPRRSSCLLLPHSQSEMC